MDKIDGDLRDHLQRSPVLSVTLLAELPELGTLDRSQIATLVGVGRLSVAIAAGSEARER